MDDEKEAFDIVLMVHPNAVPYLPVECERIAEDFTANHVGKGACLYHPYMGISYRDPTFDMYMNSQECLVGPGTEFLGGYKVLLRFRPTWPTWPLMACYFSLSSSSTWTGPTWTPSPPRGFLGFGRRGFC